MSDPPTLAVSPEPGFADGMLAIRAAGFPAGGVIELRARMTDGFGATWESTNFYAADQNGTVDPSTTPSIDGRVDPMRPIWTLRPVDQPRVMCYRAPPDLSDETVHFTAVAGDGRSAAATHTRRHLSPDVARREITAAGLHGIVFSPRDLQRRATIIVLASSTGGVNERDAALYAAHGYTACALAYFNYGDLPAVLSEIPLEYVARALEWLSQLDCADPQRIAVTGRSRGGELALLLGGTFPQFKCVIADVASGLTWEGYGVNESAPSAAWTWRGRPLPFLPSRAYAALERQARSGDREWDEARFLREAGIRTDELRRCEIPVENTNGPILMISGEEDRVWPGGILSQIAEHRLARFRFRQRVVHLRYPAAGHFVVPPCVPTTVLSVTHPVTGEMYSLGGTPEGSHRASCDSWRHKREFLDAAIG